MEPAVWGPKMWGMLFACAYHLPPSSAAELFDAMKDLVPCPRCRRHYRAHHARVPFDAASADAAARWLWTIRDMVNQTLGQRTLAFAELDRRHRTFTAPVSVFDVLDCMAVVALVLEDGHCDSFWRAFSLLRACLQATAPAHAALLSDPGDEHRSPATAWLHILACKNAALAHVGMPAQSREEWIAQYEHCRAAEATKPVSGTTASSSRRRRRV